MEFDTGLSRFQGIGQEPRAPDIIHLSGAQGTSTTRLFLSVNAHCIIFLGGKETIIPMDEKKETAPIPDQYRELNFYARHYDQRLWMVPGAAYTLSILFYSIIFKTGTLLLGRVVLAVLNAAIFSAFFIQFIKDRCFQLHI